MDLDSLPDNCPGLPKHLVLSYHGTVQKPRNYAGTSSGCYVTIFLGYGRTCSWAVINSSIDFLQVRLPHSK